MVILVIDIDGVGSVGAPSKGQSPVLIDPDSPPTLAAQCMKPPSGNVHGLRSPRSLKMAKLKPDLFDVARIDAFGITLPPISLKLLRSKAPDHRLCPLAMNPDVMQGIT
jgi:hypothetical protein